MTSIYRPILKIAWKILWQAKYLWFFGLFAVLVTNTGELNMVINNFSSVMEQNSVLQNFRNLYTQGLLGHFGENLKALVGGFGWPALIVMVILVVLFLFVLWLAISAQGALIAGAYREYRKQQSDLMSAFKTGWRNFWPLLGVNVLGKVFIYGILILVSVPLVWIYVRQVSQLSQFLFILLSFIILVPLAVIVSFLVRYAVMFVVLKKEKVWSAIAQSWKLFTKNWVVSVEMAILMFLVSVAVAIILIVLALLLVLPMSFLIYTFYSLQVSGILMIVTSILLLAFALFFIWLGALLSSYQMICWVLLFDKLSEGSVYAKVARVAAEISLKMKARREMKAGKNEAGK